MNAVEIEEAISALAGQPFDREAFPFAFLEAFGNKATTIKKLRTGASNKSDLGGVLQTNNIHIKVCAEGEVTNTLKALRESPATRKAKAKFVLATDGADFQAEDLTSDEPPVVCDYPDFPDHFGFFLALAGITTVKQIRESAFDIRATSRLNRLYVELLKDNPDWGAADRRPDMNHFMARLIFCFFAEDTDNRRVAYRGDNEASNPITIFEFKRPQRDDFADPSSKEDPVQQIIRYVNQIREGKFKTPTGRVILVNDTTPFYGYVVCDLTKKVKDWLQKEKDFTSMPDDLGWFNWFGNISLYMEVISWTKLLRDAEMRNKIFFNKLGID